MPRFIIHGQNPLSGALHPSGNKNAALPMLAASLLTDEPVILNNVPDIQDVSVMLEILDDLGVSIERKKKRLTLCADSLKKQRLKPSLCGLVRGSILFAGPLTARYGSCALYPPGGDVIGHRRLDTHFQGLRALGVKIKKNKTFSFHAARLQGAYILFDEASVTATENIMMAAALASGKTTIYNAACEPHVHDLGLLLNKMGARIKGLGTNTLNIQGVRRLRGARHTVSPDYTEIGSFVAAAAATRGRLTISSLSDQSALPILERGFNKLGVQWKITKRSLALPARQPLVIGQEEEEEAAILKFEDGTWPSFPSDLMSVALVLATQAKGNILFFEKLFESRMYFVDQLIGMGARLIQCDPHRVMVTGPCSLHGARIATPDIRAGMALIIAALCAKGQSVIENADIIDRGYENVDKKLRALGADIVRVD